MSKDRFGLRFSRHSSLTQSLIRPSFAGQVPAATSLRGVAQVPDLQVSRLPRRDEEQMWRHRIEQQLDWRRSSSSAHTRALGDRSHPPGGNKRTLVTPPFCDGKRRLTSGFCSEGSYKPTEPEKDPAARTVVPPVWLYGEKASEDMIPTSGRLAAVSGMETRTGTRCTTAHLSDLIGNSESGWCACGSRLRQAGRRQRSRRHFRTRSRGWCPHLVRRSSGMGAPRSGLELRTHLDPSRENAIECGATNRSVWSTIG